MVYQKRIDITSNSRFKTPELSLSVNSTDFKKVGKYFVKYKFTMDVTMVDGSYNWIATPLTGNQELIKIFKYSTN